MDPLGKGGGGGGVLGMTGPNPSYPSLFILSIITIRDHRTILETGKKHLITLSAHNFFL